MSKPVVVSGAVAPARHHADGTAKSPTKVPDAISVSTSVKPVPPSPVSVPATSTNGARHAPVGVVHN